MNKLEFINNDIIEKLPKLLNNKVNFILQDNNNNKFRIISEVEDFYFCLDLKTQEVHKISKVEIERGYFSFVDVDITLDVLLEYLDKIKNYPHYKIRMWNKILLIPISIYDKEKDIYKEGSLRWNLELKYLREQDQNFIDTLNEYVKSLKD